MTRAPFPATYESGDPPTEPTGRQINPQPSGGRIMRKPNLDQWRYRIALLAAIVAAIVSAVLFIPGPASASTPFCGGTLHNGQACAVLYWGTGIIATDWQNANAYGLCVYVTRADGQNYYMRCNTYGGRSVASGFPLDAGMFTVRNWEGHDAWVGAAAL